MVKVQIPATTANLGAGFDSLGMAVSLYNTVEIELSDSITIISNDGSKVPSGKDNMIYRTVSYLFNLVGRQLPGLKIIQGNSIPMTRGLGSSSACIVGGLMCANSLLGNKFSQNELINIAAILEGHPDNTSPAILGGLVTAVLDNQKVHYVKQEVSHKLKLVAIIPDYHLSTVLARKCLPSKVAHTDAVYNVSRASLLVASIQTEKFENIRVAVDDRLHQPYRMELIGKAHSIFEACYRNKAYGVYISGAGPTIMAIIDNDNTIFTTNMSRFLEVNSIFEHKVIEFMIDNVGAKFI